MRDPTLFRWFEDRRTNDSFVDVASLSSRQYEQQYDLELVCRYFALKNASQPELSAISNVDMFLTETVLKFADEQVFRRDVEHVQFDQLFGLLGRVLGDRAFKRYDQGKGRFLGGFLVSAFEAVTVGISAHLDAWSEHCKTTQGEDDLVRRVEALWAQSDFRDKSGSGIRGSTRIPAIIPAARNHFAL
jgi:hypothetical protein